jgi:hypothetical protein
MRINFFGGPGSGKSTTTARVFAQLKERQLSVEHVSEYVKAWAYQGRDVNPFDQVYLFGKQHQYEYRYLARGVRNIVTDSPCFLSAFYAKHRGVSALVRPLVELCFLYDGAHPCVNLFLRRGDKPYVQAGRWQSQEEAREIDTQMFAMLVAYYPTNLVQLDFDDHAGILRTVLQAVD